MGSERLGGWVRRQDLNLERFDASWAPACAGATFLWGRLGDGEERVTLDAAVLMGVLEKIAFAHHKGA